jgi:hypothetical protein
MKVIPIMKYHIYTGHGIRKDFYGGINEPNAGTGQENITLSNAYRDKSCYIIKDIEKK